MEEFVKMVLRLCVYVGAVLIALCIVALIVCAVGWAFRLVGVTFMG